MDACQQQNDQFRKEIFDLHAQVPCLLVRICHHPVTFFVSMMVLMIDRTHVRVSFFSHVYPLGPCMSSVDFGASIGEGGVRCRALRRQERFEQYDCAHKRHTWAIQGDVLSLRAEFAGEARCFGGEETEASSLSHIDGTFLSGPEVACARYFDRLHERRPRC